MYAWNKAKSHSLKKKAVDHFGGKCQRCGYNKCIQALEFNHLGGKNHEPSKMFQNGFGWDKILEELKDCELLCANCHREFTFSETSDTQEIRY